MRPVEKWTVGTQVVLDSGNYTVQSVYKPYSYSKAKELLLHNLGDYCSYCGKSDPQDLELEHICPQSLYPDLVTKWDNFLLACATCNGAGNKGNKDVVIGECHLPHLNNTFMSFVYKTGGVIVVNPRLDGISRRNAEALYNLVGLGKLPTKDKKDKDKDKRAMVRFEIWNLAEINREKFDKGELNLDLLMTVIKLSGGWSIWFTVFNGVDEVRKRLIDEFPGTAKDCFDANNHYEPIFRNPNNMNDPV